MKEKSFIIHPEVVGLRIEDIKGDWFKRDKEEEKKLLDEALRAKGIIEKLVEEAEHLVYVRANDEKPDKDGDVYIVFQDTRPQTVVNYAEPDEQATLYGGYRQWCVAVAYDTLEEQRVEVKINFDGTIS